MKEQDRGATDPFEQTSSEYRELLSNAEFGSAIRLAIADQLNLKLNQAERRAVIQDLATITKTDIAGRIEEESNLRIYEMRIARLEEKIDELSVTKPGYSQARNTFSDFDFKIRDLLRQESKQQFPEKNPADYIDEWIWDIYYEMLSTIEKSEKQ